MRTRDSFDDLLHRHHRLLFSLCRHFTHRGLDPDDLIQEAAIAIWRSRDKLLSLGNVQQTALIWKIARNAMIDALRRIEDTSELPQDYDKSDDDHSVRQELYEQISRLDEPDRTIVRMQLEGYSYEEIGKSLGLTEKNVSVRLVRTKEKLRKQMVI